MCLCKSKFSHRYHKTNLITKTPFSKVYDCVSLDNRDNKLIVKIQNPLLNTNDIQQEIKILKHLKHPSYICNLVYDEHRICQSYLVFEKIEGPILFDYISKNTSIKEKINIVAQLLSGFAFIQNKNIIHRDIKGDNIMVDISKEKPQIKLIDFGLSTYQKNLKVFNTNTPCGNINYMCPEMASFTFYNASCDTWSLGVLIYFIFTRHFPYKITRNILNNCQMFHVIPSQMTHICYHMISDIKVKKLLENMMLINRDDRPLIKDITF